MLPVRTLRDKPTSGLTMNIAGASLPYSPLFVPQPSHEDPQLTGSYVHQATSRSSAPKSDPRSRYVLAPGISHQPPVPSMTDIPPTPGPPPPALTASLNPSGPTEDFSASPQSYGVDNIISSFSTPYQPVTAHWFYATNVQGNRVWWPFSCFDSNALEAGAFRLNMSSPVSDDFLSLDTSSEVVVSVEGGRYDVFITQRERRSVYWDEEPCEVRRASWFYRLPGDSRVLPFSEKVCGILEEHYKASLENGNWPIQFDAPSEDVPEAIDVFVFHGPQSMVQYIASPHKAHSFGSQSYPFDADDSGSFCPIRRGLDDQLLARVDPGERHPPDHVMFVIHGIGPIHNLRREGLVQCVNDLRRTSRSILETHFPEHQGRVEFLPILWHQKLHSEATGLDAQLDRITLRSIPKLRHFTNRTLMDILFYTSPKYCQVIVDAVTQEVARLHEIFLSRNPTFNGKFSIIGHSLGSVIAFDLLANQPANSAGESQQTPSDRTSIQNAARLLDGAKLARALRETGLFEDSHIDMVAQLLQTRLKHPGFWSRSIAPSDTSGGIGMPLVNYPQLPFSPSALFLLGSPLALFFTARGLHHLPAAFHLPTCPTLFNIFHPFDPVAYRIETLIDESFTHRAVLLPHHKGRKRFHLQFKDDLARVGSDLKTRFYQSIQSTWRSLQEFATAHNIFTVSSDTASPVVDDDPNDDDLAMKVKRVLSQMGEANRGDGTGFECQSTGEQPSDEAGAEVTQLPSRLNSGQRIDYVLQEAPLESFSDYLFALGSHAVYWESEDVALFILSKAYESEQEVPHSSTHYPPATSISTPVTNPRHNQEQQSGSQFGTVPSTVMPQAEVRPTYSSKDYHALGPPQPAVLDLAHDSTAQTLLAAAQRSGPWPQVAPAPSLVHHFAPPMPASGQTPSAPRMLSMANFSGTNSANMPPPVSLPQSNRSDTPDRSASSSMLELSQVDFPPSVPLLPTSVCPSSFSPQISNPPG